jgi:hypothetical protein
MEELHRIRKLTTRERTSTSPTSPTFSLFIRIAAILGARREQSCSVRCAVDLEGIGDAGEAEGTLASSSWASCPTWRDLARNKCGRGDQEPFDGGCSSQWATCAAAGIISASSGQVLFLTATPLPKAVASASWCSSPLECPSAVATADATTGHRV